MSDTVVAKKLNVSEREKLFKLSLTLIVWTLIIGTLAVFYFEGVRWYIWVLVFASIFFCLIYGLWAGMEDSNESDDSPDFGEEFRSLRFNGAYAHPNGEIPALLIGRTQERDVTHEAWGLRAGSSYKPTHHAHAHHLYILEGRGIFYYNGHDQPYQPHDLFFVDCNEPHSFIEVHETTVVVQSSWGK